MQKTTKCTFPDKTNVATLGFVEKLWAASNKLRSFVDTSENKHIVLGLIFFKYISDAFETHRRGLDHDLGNPYNELWTSLTKSSVELALMVGNRKCRLT